MLSGSDSARRSRRLLARCLAVPCLLLGLLLVPARPTHAAGEPGWRGRPLVEWLNQLRSEGLMLVFSSAVVGEHLRVGVEPDAPTPRLRLDQVLAPLGLKAVDGPGGTILILAASRARDSPELRFAGELEVTGSGRWLRLDDDRSAHGLHGDTMSVAPAAGGDVSRLVEMLPGVAMPDNSAAFNLRGGVAHDVAVVLDGLELSDPFHLRSFHSPYSVVDGGVVESIELLTGGFTVEHGDRHAGFVEVATVTPRSPVEAQGELGTLNSRLEYGAGDASGRKSLLLAARGWYPDAITHATDLGRGEQMRPVFADLYAKAELNLASGHRLSAHALLVHDRLRFDETGEAVNESVDARTRNHYLWLRARSAWSDRLDSETLLALGEVERRRDGVSSESGAIRIDDDREFELWTLRHDATFSFTERQSLRAGGELRWMSAEYRYASRREPRAPLAGLATDPAGASLAGWAAYRLRPHPALALELGARFDHQSHFPGQQASPRFNAAWRHGESLELRFGLGRFAQSQRLDELAIEDGETGFHPAELADQAELSLRQGLPRGLQLRIDGYARRLRRPRPRYENLFEPIELFPETAADRVRVAPERARSRGLEVLLGGDPEQALGWWLSYTLASADDRIEGRWVPRSWDQTHAGKLLLAYRRGQRWSVGLAASAHGGWPTTPVLAAPGPGGSDAAVPVPGPRNSIRFASYFRLDLKAGRSFDLPRGRLWLNFELINLTDRGNPCCLDDVVPVSGPGGAAGFERVDESWLGIRPAFSLRWDL